MWEGLGVVRGSRVHPHGAEERDEGRREA